MTLQVRLAPTLGRRRRVLESAERRLRGAINRAAVRPHDIERVRAAQLGFLKGLRRELQPGTEVDDAVQDRLTGADHAERAWRAAAPHAIIAAYASGRPIPAGHVPETFTGGDTAPQ